jgi:hypothetical protein
MINILKFPFRPKTCCWIHEPGAGQTLLAVTDMDTPTIRIYEGTASHYTSLTSCIVPPCISWRWVDSGPGVRSLRHLVAMLTNR